MRVGFAGLAWGLVGALAFATAGGALGATPSGPWGAGAAPSARAPAVPAPAEAPTVEALVSAATPDGDAAWRCLAEAVYFEARGEPLMGQVAVAEVVLNRSEAPAFPGTVCGVVEQAGGGSCQFSYRCDGRSDAIGEAAAWDRAGRVARAMLDGAPRTLTGGATFYHADSVSPSWSRRFDLTASIGAHRFYREPLVLASN